MVVGGSFGFDLGWLWLSVPRGRMAHLDCLNWDFVEAVVAAIQGQAVGLKLPERGVDGELFCGRKKLNCRF